MNFQRLKELVRKLGGVLVLDGEEPEFVILSYDKYEKMEAGEEVSLSTNNNSNSRMKDGSTSSPQVGSTHSINSGQAGSPQVGSVEINGVISPFSDIYTSGENEGRQDQDVEKLNQEILVLKEEIRLKEEAELHSDGLVELIENEETEGPDAETVDFN